MGRKNRIGLCPFNCFKYQVACEAIQKLSNKNKELKAENQVLQKHAQVMDSFKLLSEEGYQIIGIEGDCVAVMWPVSKNVWDEHRHFYLYKLPYKHHADWICMFSLKYKSNCRAFLCEITSHKPDRGYGSLLMTHLINFLRASGIRYITGTINATDFDHEDKLRHFYGKFGFQITNHKQSRYLHLDLYGEHAYLVPHDHHTVCCRCDAYPSLRAEMILEESEQAIKSPNSKEQGDSTAKN